MAQVVKIAEIQDMPLQLLMKEVYSKLNKTGIMLYQVFLDNKDEQFIELTYKLLESYGITKRQYQLGLQDLKSAGFIIEDEQASALIFQGKKLIDIF